MKCPIDGTALTMTDRQGIEIDYCPECRGVWLDRGELDKIIERSDTGAVAIAPAPSEAPRYQEPRPNPSNRNNNYDERQYGKKRKKESFLGDLFDF